MMASELVQAKSSEMEEDEIKPKKGLPTDII